VNPVPVALALITLVFAFCGDLVGRRIMRRAPEAASDTRGFVRIVAGLMTSMVGLLLSLQLSSAKTAFDTQERQVDDIGAEIVFFDKALAHSGRGSATPRATLYQLVEDMYQRSWPDALRGTRVATPPGADVLFEQINAIAPANASEQFAKSVALSSALDVGKTLRQLSAQHISSAALTLLIVEMAWTAGIFILYGLLAPNNRAAFTVLAITAMTVASAIYLIAEMSEPFSGIIRISSEPIAQALSQIGH
jgi:hypothetical protein